MIDDVDDALDVEASRRLDNNDAARAAWARASSHSEAKDFDQALPHLIEVTRLCPNEPALLQVLANTYRDAGDATIAEEAYRRVLSLDPHWHRAHCQLGRLLWEVERHKEGEYHYRLSLRIKNDVITRILFGCDLARSERLAEARGQLEEALRLQPDNDEAHYNLGVVLRDEDPAGAREHLERVVSIDPEYGIAHTQLGCWHVEHGSIPEARQHLLRAESLLGSSDAQVRELKARLEERVAGEA